MLNISLYYKSGKIANLFCKENAGKCNLGTTHKSRSEDLWKKRKALANARAWNDIRDMGFASASTPVAILDVFCNQIACKGGLIICVDYGQAVGA